MRLVTLSELQPHKDWYLPNPYIHSMYRRPGTWKEAAQSMVQWHNETLNIHTHLWPGIMWLYMAYTCVDEEYYLKAPWYSQTVILFGYLSGAIMGLASGLAHTFYYINPRWASLCWKMDYVGIIGMGLSHQLLDSIILFRGVYDWPGLYYVLTLCQLLFGTYCAYDVFLDRSGINWGIIYTGISCIFLTVPTAVLSYQIGQQELAISTFTCSLLVGIGGTIFYQGKLPERFWNPNGIFTIFNSHVYHHILAILAVMAAFNCFHFLYRLSP